MSDVTDIRTIPVRIVNQYRCGDYFAEGIIADGPWEARFRFCAKYGVSPDKVSVMPEIRMKGYEYFCSAGELERGLFFVNHPSLSWFAASCQ